MIRERLCPPEESVKMFEKKQVRVEGRVISESTHWEPLHSFRVTPDFVLLAFKGHRREEAEHPVCFTQISSWASLSPNSNPGPCSLHLSLGHMMKTSIFPFRHPIYSPITIDLPPCRSSPLQSVESTLPSRPT